MADVKKYNSSTWARFKKNKAAVAGLVIIILSVVLAVFAYLIAPDGSSNANRIVPEISNQRSGFSVYLLQVKKNGKQPAYSALSVLVSGREDPYTYIPLVRYSATKDSIIFDRYIDEGISDRQSISKKLLGDNPVIHERFLLGTDKFGRDILSRLIVGIRVSLNVGLIAVVISLTIGILLGALAGYYRGFVDDIIMWFINIIWSIPTLLLVFAITLVLGKGFWQIFIAVGLTMWVNIARLIRGQVMSLKEKEFIEAGRAMGFSDLRIISRHILPNILGPVAVIAASNFASAIVIEAGLSFLGVGVQPPQPSWGLMIKENYNFIITHNPLLAIIPGLAIMVLVLAFNMVGNGLRDALNVRSKVL
ncbi:MAG: transporter permease [Chitinophagaceae bacterium]|nr:transporter permease [Chitinophagaceae bacterium]